MPIDTLPQVAAITAIIWVVVEAIRKIPFVKKVSSVFDGEALALLVSMVAIIILVLTGQLPPDGNTIIKVLGAGLAAQVAHDKIASPTGL